MTLSASDIERIHDSLVLRATAETTPGTRVPDDLETIVFLCSLNNSWSTSRVAVEYAYRIVANHPFVDANKRTALATMATHLYHSAGLCIPATREIGIVLKILGTNHEAVRMGEFASYVDSRAYPMQTRPDFIDWHYEAYSEVYEWLETE